MLKRLYCKYSSDLAAKTFIEYLRYCVNRLTFNGYNVTFKITMNKNGRRSIALNENDSSNSSDSIALLREWLEQVLPTVVYTFGSTNNTEGNLSAPTPEYLDMPSSICASNQTDKGAVGNTVDKDQKEANNCKLTSPCSLPSSLFSSLSVSRSSPFDSLNSTEMGDFASQNTANSMSISPTDSLGVLASQYTAKSMSDSLVSSSHINCSAEVLSKCCGDNKCENNNPLKINEDRLSIDLDSADEEELNKCDLQTTPPKRTEASTMSVRVILDEFFEEELERVPHAGLNKECGDRKSKPNSRSQSMDLMNVFAKERGAIRFSFRSPLSKKRAHRSFIPWRSNPPTSPPQSPTAYNPPIDTVAASEEESTQSIAKEVEILTQTTPDIELEEGNDKHCIERQVKKVMRKYSPSQPPYSPSAVVYEILSTPEESIGPMTPIYEPYNSPSCRSSNNSDCSSTHRKYSPSQLPYQSPSSSKKEERPSRKRHFHSSPSRCCCCCSDRIEYSPYHPSYSYDQSILTGEKSSSHLCISPRAQKVVKSASSQTLIHVAPDDTLSPHAILRRVNTMKDNLISSPYDPERFVPKKHYQIQF